MTPEEREALLAAHALGSLSEPDARDAERLIRSDELAAVEYERYRELADLIALSVPLRRADPMLRERVLDAARRSRRPRRAPRWQRWMPAAGIAAALALVTVWAVSLQHSLDELRQDTSVLAAVVESNAKQIESVAAQAQRDATNENLGIRLETALKEQQTLLEVQADPDVIRIELQPTTAAHGATGHYLWSDAADAGLVVAKNLPPLGFTGIFEVWLEDVLGRRAQVATFSADEVGSAQVLVTAPGTADPARLFIVVGSSLESGTPDGPVVMQAAIMRQP